VEQADTEPELHREAVAQALTDGLPQAEALQETTGEAEPEELTVLEEHTEALESTVTDGEAAELWVSDTLLVMLPELLLQAEEKGDAEELRDALLLEAEALLLMLVLMEGVGEVLLTGLEREADAETDVVQVPESVELTEAEAELEKALLAELASELQALAVKELLTEPETDTLRVALMVGRVAVGEPDPELDLQPEADTEDDRDPTRLAEEKPLAVLDRLLPRLALAELQAETAELWLALTVALLLREADMVARPEAEAQREARRVGRVLVGEPDTEVEGLPDLLPLWEAEALLLGPTEAEAAPDLEEVEVGVAECKLTSMVEVPLMLGLDVGQPEDVMEPDLEGEAEAEEHLELSAEAVLEAEKELLPEPQEDAEKLLSRVGRVLVGDTDKEPELVPQVDTDTDWEAEMDAEPVVERV
jgi:hypothetical protein